MEGLESCTIFDLLTVPLPSPIPVPKKNPNKSTRGIAKTDIEIPIGEKPTRVVYVPNLPDQFLAPGKDLMERTSLDLRKSADRETTKISASSTQKGLTPFLYSEKDVETYLRQTIDIPGSLIAQLLLEEGLGTPIDEGIEPMDRSIKLPYVSAAPSTYVDPSGYRGALFLMHCMS